MQIGAENRKKLIAAISLVAIAILLLARWMFSFSGSASSPTGAPQAASTAPVTTTRAAARNAGKNSRSRAKRVAGPRSLDPTLRFDWLKASEDTKYEGNGRNIFMAQAEIPQPHGNGTTDHPTEPEVSGPPQPPPPPPINLKFFGFASKPGEAKQIFLSQGEDVFIASEGQIVNRHYKVVKISPTSVEIEDVLNNNRQSIPLTQG